jgi:hypothetical protein
VPRLTNIALAEHWGTSRSYPIELRKRRAMPDFEDLGEAQADRFAAADEWRRLNAPPRRHRRKESEVSGQGERASGTDAPDTGSLKGVGGGDPEAAAAVKTFGAMPTDNFDLWVVDEAERVVKEQLGLYRLACQSGNHARIAGALDNWETAARRCADLRERFLKIQERSAQTIQIDRARDIVGRELGRLQEQLDAFAEKWAAPANPEAPEVARGVLSQAIDELYEQMASVSDAVIATASAKRVA